MADLTFEQREYFETLLRVATRNAREMKGMDEMEQNAFIERRLDESSTAYMFLPDMDEDLGFEFHLLKKPRVETGGATLQTAFLVATLKQAKAFAFGYAAPAFRPLTVELSDAGQADERRRVASLRRAGLAA